MTVMGTYVSMRSGLDALWGILSTTWRDFSRKVMLCRNKCYRCADCIAIHVGISLTVTSHTSLIHTSPILSVRYHRCRLEESGGHDDLSPLAPPLVAWATRVPECTPANTPPARLRPRPRAQPRDVRCRLRDPSCLAGTTLPNRRWGRSKGSRETWVPTCPALSCPRGRAHRISASDTSFR